MLSTMPHNLPRLLRLGWGFRSAAQNRYFHMTRKCLIWRAEIRCLPMENSFGPSRRMFCLDARQ